MSQADAFVVAQSPITGVWYVNDSNGMAWIVFPDRKDAERYAADLIRAYKRGLSAAKRRTEPPPDVMVMSSAEFLEVSRT